MHLAQAPDAQLARDFTDDTIQFINLRLALLGLPIFESAGHSDLLELTAPLLARNRETSRLLADYFPPIDWRIKNWLEEYLYGTGIEIAPIRPTFALDVPGLARVLSLPPDRDEFVSDLVRSYRVRNGVLHNPASDRRTTQGIFHVAEGGLPIPDDKLAVPQLVYARMLQRAVQPPSDLLRLPFTAAQENPAECWVSLLLRPVVCPAVPGWSKQRTMEIRFFAPGSLVSNLDFVESIFGNGGDPYLPVNDAALDPEHWTGHTGCVILAPHLTKVTKKEAGLPHWDHATERQRRDGMCWREEGELYNGGSAFKLTARDERGVMVTIIADNYYGYCKKEVKTQISFSANLFGQCEEEHAGGAYVYASYDLGEEFSGNYHVKWRGHSFEEVRQLYGEAMDLMPEGYGVDRKYPDIIYVPEHAHFDLHSQTVSWPAGQETRSIKLLPSNTYVRPSGYKVRMEKPPGKRAWRLIGTVAEPVLCHKPCTVSGGGKSEISKSISDAIIQGPTFVADLQRDLDEVERLLSLDYSQRFRDPAKRGGDSRSILGPERSLGSVIQLFMPSEEEFSEEYNAWLDTIPQYIKELVFVVKRFYKTDWGERWRDHFSTDAIDGKPGNELKCDGRKLVSNYLRVGFSKDGSWRVFGLRKDFHPASKIQAEDDITVSAVVPTSSLGGLPAESQGFPSVKFVHNCETRLFQRPDECVNRGYDLQAEADLASPGNFLSNFEPLTQRDARLLVEDAIGFAKFTEPMQRLILDAAQGRRGPAYFVSSAHPRLVDGKPSKNPRYLQMRPDLLQPREVYLAEMSTRLQRRLPLHAPVPTPVNGVVPGRRNNPPEQGIRALCAYSPIHYMEPPELFMEWICSMTGKSPSTTGAGSEGALTKGPFNALPGIVDLNAALVSHLLTGADAFLSSAGYIGPRMRVDHDISLLIPEVWARMAPQERRAAYMIEQGYLERCTDTEFEGRPVLAGRLGWRITAGFVRHFFGRIFHHPHVVFPEEMLRPELQDPAVFADAMENIVQTQRRVAESFFADGTIELACPPLRALLHVMRDGQWHGQGLQDEGFRALFTREHLLSSDWYAERLAARQAVETRRWRDASEYLEKFLKKPHYAGEAERLGIASRTERAWDAYHLVKSEEARKELIGTVGLQPWPSSQGIP